MNSRAANVLAALPEAAWAEWRPALEQAFAAAGLKVSMAREMAPEAVDYILYTPGSGLEDFSPYRNAKAVLSLWAGVERIVRNETLTHPLARMVDPGLKEGMRDYVLGHVLRAHLEMDADICRRDARWQPHVPPLARERCVGMLGLGALGEFCARALAGLGFEVLGWSRGQKALEGVTCHAGAEGLEAVLRRAEILVLLLPLTTDTENILDGETLALLPPGAALINPGRGALIDDEALLAALDGGQVGHATLDVFRNEPLPAAHPYWTHPKVTVTPHIAAQTRPSSAAAVIAENIRRGEAGEPLLYLVDRDAGY